ncbi:MAG: pilus assembly protein N-terminal domain-containing protein [Alphaproteobacteria bacterium]
MKILKSHHGPRRGRQVQLLACLIILAATLGISFATVPRAQAAGVILLEVGKTRILPLSRPADVIMLGNPAVADVVVEGNGRIFLLGREPGETNLMILDQAGKVILSSAIVVGPVNKRRITIDRRQVSSTLSCNPRCSPVATPRGSGATTAGPAAAGAVAPGGQNQPAGGGAAAGGAGTANLAGALDGLSGGVPGTR